jgi:hypothetical protein
MVIPQNQSKHEETTKLTTIISIKTLELHILIMKWSLTQLLNSLPFPKKI